MEEKGDIASCPLLDPTLATQPLKKPQPGPFPFSPQCHISQSFVPFLKMPSVCPLPKSILPPWSHLHHLQPILTQVFWRLHISLVPPLLTCTAGGKTTTRSVPFPFYWVPVPWPCSTDPKHQLSSLQRCIVHLTLLMFP